ncbi:MAG: methyltransferase domain-containing protein, partial [Clostridia bacterium]|nr:methyltransferase domain-containing protein [Clostridia bacterium]
FVEVFMWWSSGLRCLICGAATSKQSNSLFCHGTRRHCFDFSADGYVNLAASKATGGGDDATLIAARTAFLSGGHYKPFAARISELLRTYSKGSTVVDAGCGEGYYTCRLAGAGFQCYGFDLSKRGVRAAAKRATREGVDAFFAVAGIYTLPLQDASVDAVISLFAPVAEQEFLRVLKPGGILLVAGAGRNHLLSLKRVLYDQPHENEPRADLPVSMTELTRETLSFSMELEGSAIGSLFAMTPYYYRTSREGQERLATCEHLTCEAEMDIFIYQKP